jgi:hypothetical protein
MVVFFMLLKTELFHEYDSVMLNGKTHEGAHCQQMLEPGAKVHVRALASGFTEVGCLYCSAN